MGLIIIALSLFRLLVAWCIYLYVTAVCTFPYPRVRSVVHSFITVLELPFFRRKQTNQ